MSTSLGTSNTDHDDTQLDIDNKDITNNNDNDNDNDNTIQIDPMKKEIEEYDIETKLQILHDMIQIKFSLLDEKNQREFNEIKRMINPTFDSPRRYVHNNNRPLSSPITSDDDTVDYINYQNEVPPIIINKPSYFKSLMKALKRKVKALF